MDRITIKQNAQKMIKGNLWYIWKPLAFFMLILIPLYIIAGIIDYKTGNDFISSFVGGVTSIISAPFAVGYAYYCLGFVRGQRMEVKDVYNFAKEHWIISILVSLLAGINILIGMILLIVPGIIAALGLSFYCYVVADNPELSTRELLKKAWDMTVGYKADLFVFFLSFLGWIILTPFTLGILYIWLIPYMTVAEVLVYESLKK